MESGNLKRREEEDIFVGLDDSKQVRGTKGRGNIINQPLLGYKQLKHRKGKELTKRALCLFITF